MNRKKMAIVSSYSESCGNAAFTKVLHDSIELFHSEIDVKVIELDISLLQSINKHVRSKADKHIDFLCEELKQFDMVNIQMEAGLYGTFPNDIIRRFSKLISANPSTSVTLHSPRLINTSSNASRRGLKKLLKFDIIGGIKDLIGDKYATFHLSINRKIVEHSIENKATLIVHTNRAKKQIKDFFSYENVIVHPLKFVSAEHSPNAKTLGDIKFQAGILDSDITVGMFGYISPYKGHTDALKALDLLPKNYKLLIFGRQHPQSLKSDGLPDKYLNFLNRKILENDNLKDRVYFLGELSDEDFLYVAGAVDLAWLPYYENGQDGSGIASICLDLCSRVLCSSSFAFDELFKLVNYKNKKRFDIGNVLELALKTQMFMNAPKPVYPYSDEDVYTLNSQAQVYVNGLIN